ncbi:ABC-three component system protein [Paenibacillus sp. FSL K6-0276]|uniref:ABC-three component system protein n=1 Tax=Paenibacillus sp. FSL K6-0276 TaxID=2921450 RepID=UPI0030EC919E
MSFQTNGENSPIYSSENMVINHFSSPIMIDPDELGALINIFFSKIDGLREISTATFNEKLRRTNIKRKNQINGMTKEYYGAAVRDYIVYFNEIDDYLSEPTNEQENKRYRFIARDVNRKIAAFKKRFGAFDETFEHVVTKFTSEASQKFELDFHKKELIPILIAYMYYFCDVGENDEIDA